ncbi:TMV resistance protein N [Artemisia annua]|uniref:TMV resistance protein N n=1 Tax=Artemisia annua TaxID=35608 RepID=A0A2U1LM12_ARTAN|nr:TMV resistance protein N [Artemisia annua]
MVFVPRVYQIGCFGICETSRWMSDERSNGFTGNYVCYVRLVFWICGMLLLWFLACLIDCVVYGFTSRELCLSVGDMRAEIRDRTGNFTGLENLEKLDLFRCYNLKELDSSIGCLKKLVELDLRLCTRLKRLPWEMICKLTSLQKLDLFDSFNLPEISHEIGSLISLKHLNLSGNTFSSLPDSLCQLHQLTKIELYYCTNLKSIPDLPPSIKDLQANYCENLVNLPSNCSELQFLRELWLNDCCKLGSEGFIQVTRLRNLKKLYMQNCNISQVSSGIGNFVSLEYLSLSGNTFSSLPESFSNLSKLERLFIDNCSQLQLLPPLPSQLNSIRATDCWSLDVMPFDSMQKAYTFHSKVFMESLMNPKGLYIGLSGKELPEWCTYQNSGNVLSFVAPIPFDSKICGLIFCATTDNWTFLEIHNKTKEKSHCIETIDHIITTYSTLQVMFYPLNDKTVVVEAGDTVEVKFNDTTVAGDTVEVRSCGLRRIYENDMVLRRLRSCGLHLVYEDDMLNHRMFEANKLSEIDTMNGGYVVTSSVWWNWVTVSNFKLEFLDCVCYMTVMW